MERECNHRHAVCNRQGRSINDLVAYRNQNTPGWQEAAMQSAVGMQREEEIAGRQKLFEAKLRNTQRVRALFVQLFVVRLCLSVCVCVRANLCCWLGVFGLVHSGTYGHCMTVRRAVQCPPCVLRRRRTNV